MNDAIKTAADLTDLSPAATLPLEEIDLDSFAKDAHGYYLVPPSMHMRAAAKRGWRFAIRTASALVHYGEEWAAAMAAYYGPVGLHESYCNADDTPTAETIAKFPRVREAMERGAARWDSYLNHVERMERARDYSGWWAAHSA